VLISTIGCGSQVIDYADTFMIKGVNYIGANDQVITDEKIIGLEVGSIKYNLVDGKANSQYHLKDGDATFLKVGTKIYSLKFKKEKGYVAAKQDGKWMLYKALTENSDGQLPSGNGITEGTFKATALIVEKSGVEQSIRIEDKDKIKKVLEEIKNGVETKETIGYPQENNYSFYFVIPDKNGIGQIVHKYYFKFQDVNLKGYVRRVNDNYTVDSSVNKIITDGFGNSESIYDNKLGGKQQIYDMFADGKFILRKVVKETPQEKFKVKIIKQGEEVWQNGNKVKDILIGKYKVEIFMKDTKVQEKILSMINSKQYKFHGVISINFTKADGGDSSVLYLSYDEEPDLYLDESIDSFVLVSKK
jgi:hypothetical protein